MQEARQFVESLRESGIQEYRVAQTDYYTRWSYAFVSFIVIFISSTIGGRLKKNILLLSLLVSLALSVSYYVVQLMLTLFAKEGFLPPMLGAWGAFLIFTSVGSVLFRYART